MGNFEFLKTFDEDIYEFGTKAEKQFMNGEYKLATHTLRHLMENVITYIEKKEMYMRKKNMAERLGYLLKHEKINGDLKNKFEILWSWCSDASHPNSKFQHDKQSTTARLRDAFFVVRWLYNLNSVNKIRNDFDLTKLIPIPVITIAPQENVIVHESTGMSKFIKHFFALSATHGASEVIEGRNNILDIKVDNRPISYMVLIRKFQDKISNALYPAIYIYNSFGVAFTVYGKGGYCRDNWPEHINNEKPTIESYFKNSGQYNDVLKQNPKYNYFDNHYERVYKLSELTDETYQHLSDDFERIRSLLETIRKS